MATLQESYSAKTLLQKLSSFSIPNQKAYPRLGVVGNFDGITEFEIIYSLMMYNLRDYFNASLKYNSCYFNHGNWAETKVKQPFSYIFFL